MASAALGAAALALPNAGQAWADTSTGTSLYVVSDTGSSLVGGLVSTVGGVVATALGSNTVTAKLTSTEASLLQAMPGVVVTPDVSITLGSGSSQTTATTTTPVANPSAAGVATLPTTSTTVAGSPSPSGVATPALATPALATPAASGASLAGGTSSIATTSPGFTPATSGSPGAEFTEQSGATQLWGQGDTGQGVNVAVLDTGIDPLPDFAGRLVGGVDLSGEGNPFQDSYGHGTFVSGLIAGNGASSSGTYMGEAPGAGLVAVKVAGASGNTDLGTVMAGVAWTIAHARSLNIGVLNMSLGFIPTTSTFLNPLDQMVEAAWKAGIVVVTSAGNAGPFNGTILSPGDDPYVITVGALDDQGQSNPANDAMANFSSVGPTNPDGWMKPDLVASGAHLISLRAPGSTVDVQNPSAEIGTGNFIGSGTSFSAAITSGAAALILAQNDDWSPNMVKASMLATTNVGPEGNPFADGFGDLNVAGAANSKHVQLKQSFSPAAVASGSLYSIWRSSAWNIANWSGPGSKGLVANGAAWNGAAWNGAAWNGVAWNGAAWNGFVWGGAAWNGAAWNGAAWNGAAWNGAAWNGAAWNGAAWNGAAWNGAAWNGAAWN